MVRQAQFSGRHSAQIDMGVVWCGRHSAQIALGVAAGTVLRWIWVWFGAAGTVLR